VLSPWIQDVLDGQAIPHRACSWTFSAFGRRDRRRLVVHDHPGGAWISLLGVQGGRLAHSDLLPAQAREMVAAIQSLTALDLPTLDGGRWQCKPGRHTRTVTVVASGPRGAVRAIIALRPDARAR
jgi:hypothetical protein